MAQLNANYMLIYYFNSEFRASTRSQEINIKSGDAVFTWIIQSLLITYEK